MAAPLGNKVPGARLQWDPHEDFSLVGKDAIPTTTPHDDLKARAIANSIIREEIYEQLCILIKENLQLEQEKKELTEKLANTEKNSQTKIKSLQDQIIFYVMQINELRNIKNKLEQRNGELQLKNSQT